MTPTEVIEFCKSNDIGIIDLRFTDLRRRPHTIEFFKYLGA